MDYINEKQETGRALHDLFRELFALHASLSAIMDRVHAEAGLTTPQLKVMRILSHAGPTTVPDMAARLEVSRQSVQTVCNALLSSGFLEFRDNPRHKRSKLVALTEAGRVTHKDAQEREETIIGATFEGVHPNQARAAGRLLENIRRRLERDQKT